MAKFRKDKEGTPMGLVTDPTRDERESQSTPALDGATRLRWIIVTAGIVSVWCPLQAQVLNAKLVTISWEALELWEETPDWQKYIIRMRPSNLAGSLFPGPPWCAPHVPDRATPPSLPCYDGQVLS